MDIIKQLTNDLEPIRNLAEQMLSQHVDFELLTDKLQLSKRPKIGTEAYAMTLFSGVEDATIERYETIHSIRIPPQYREILSKLNGANIFGMDLYGLPRSMTQDPPLVDRSTIQPLDLATANTYWRHEFTTNDSIFQIGGAPFSLEENLGYFLTADSDVLSVRKHDTIIDSWDTFQQFLDKELERAQKQFVDFEEYMEKMLPTVK